MGLLHMNYLPKVIEGYRKCHEDRGLSVYAVKEKESDESHRSSWL